MREEELPPLVLSLSKDTSGGRALKTMSVYFLNDHQSGVWIATKPGLPYRWRRKDYVRIRCERAVKSGV